MRPTLTVIAVLLLTTPVAAADFTINDQDQTAIQQLCDLAARSTEINREARANIAGYCLVWERRIKEAADKAAAPKTAANPTDKQK